MITITGENIIYLNNSLVTIKELRAELNKHRNSKLSILIKADRRASVGRIVDVWDVPIVLYRFPFMNPIVDATMPEGAETPNQ